MDINQKKILRKQMLNLRNSISEEMWKGESDKITQKILQMKEYKETDTILAYGSYRREADTWAVIEDALSSGKKVALPKVLGPLEMAFYEIRTMEDLIPGVMGIMEPVTEREGQPLTPVTAGLMIAPGVAFDRQGHRMGYGGGYYDHWLESYREDVKVYGIAFDFQVLDEIPYEACDQSMDVIITPNQIYR